MDGERDDWTVMGNSIGGLLTLMVAEARGPGNVKGAWMDGWMTRGEEGVCGVLRGADGRGCI